MANQKWSVDDVHWQMLFDEERLSDRREYAENKYRDLTNDQIKQMRKRCKNDLFFLAYGVLEYDLLSERLHGHYAQWLQSTWGERYRLTLKPRDHYKTTMNTVSDTIQMALPNDAGVQHHPYSLGPNIKLLLSHETRESSSRFLYEITQAFREKPLMLALYPELIPSKRNGQRMNKWELDLPRDEHHREPTFDTIGAGGAAQGRHYNWIKMDDLVGEDARDSETVMKRVLTWFDNVNSLLTRLKLDGWDLTGTRWAATDVYSHAVKMYGVKKDKSILNAYFPDDIERMEPGQLVAYARAAIENGQPIFPEEFSIEDLNRIRKNQKVWAAQYANNPRASDLTEFSPHWLKFYNVSPNGRITVFSGDSSWSVNTRDLDRVILIDPSVGESDSSDEWGVVVTGTDHQMNIYVLEAYRKRMRPPEGIDEMFQLYTKWNPRLISIESVAFSAMLKYWFEEKCRQLGVYPSIYDYKPGSKKSKEARIRGLGNYGAAGQIYCLEGMHQLRDEWEWFPLGESDHILDALAQGPEVWTKGLRQEDTEYLNQAIEKVIDDRDALTGYSAI